MNILIRIGIPLFIVFSIYYFQLADVSRQLKEFYFLNTHGGFFISLLAAFILLRYIEKNISRSFFIEKRLIIAGLIIVGLNCIFDIVLLFVSKEQHTLLCNSPIIGYIFLGVSILILLCNYINIVWLNFYGKNFIIMTLFGITLMIVVTLIIL